MPNKFLHVVDSRVEAEDVLGLANLGVVHDEVGVVEGVVVDNVAPVDLGGEEVDPVETGIQGLIWVVVRRFLHAHLRVVLYFFLLDLLSLYLEHVLQLLSVHALSVALLHLQLFFLLELSLQLLHPRVLLS